MSDSGLSSVNIPTDVEYEQSLKRAVRNGLKAAEEVSVNTARERAEKELGLEAGFFKNDATWKGKSKSIVQAAFEDPQSSPEKAKAKAKPVVTKAKSGTKRKSNDAPPASNKRTKKGPKTVPDSDASELSDSEVDDTKKQADDGDEQDASDFGDSEADEKPKPAAKTARGKAATKSQAKPAAKRKPASKKVKDESDLSSETEGEAQPAPKATKKKAVVSKKSQDVVQSDSEGEDEDAASKPTKGESDSKNDELSKADSKPPTAEDDESDMSVLIDDPPPKKKRASNGTTKSKATKASKPAASKKKGPDLTPNEEEIKRLQGWLVKCGVRKMWHNELKGCETEKDKIKHLKKMLEDVGMTGRYSNEKAKDIFESRELAAELEEAQKYAAKWGTKDDKDDGSGSGEESGDEEVEPRAAAVPRKPKGFVDFGDSGDESD